MRHCIGKDPVTGKYLKPPWKTVYCTKREAPDELAKYKKELIEQDEIAIHPKKVLIRIVQAYVETYLTELACNEQKALHEHPVTR